MKKELIRIQEFNILILKITGIGRIKVISTSKIKKITAIRKKRIEKGVREKY
jgi:hypothetical protein